MEGHLVFLLMSSKKQPRIISLQTLLGSSVPETADTLPRSVLWNIWVFLRVFPLTIESCTRQLCCGADLGSWGWFAVSSGWVPVAFWDCCGTGGDMWVPDWLYLGSRGQEAGYDKKNCENNLHVFETEQEGLFPTGSYLGHWTWPAGMGNVWGCPCITPVPVWGSTLLNRVECSTMWIFTFIHNKFLINFINSSLLKNVEEINYSQCSLFAFI